MAISSREQNILILASIVAAIFVVTNVWPRIAGFYNERQENIENVRLDIERELRLIDETELWQERRENVEQMQATLEKQVFAGGTIPVIEANIQRQLSQKARESGITVNSTRLAERLETDAWLLISQEMSFRTTDASNTIIFLQKLNESEPRLRVTDFNVNRSRNQYSGSITVVGFAKSASLTAQVSSVR